MFADAHSIAVGEKKVELDGNNENASVLRLFLKFISTGEIEISRSLKGIVDVARFCQKWDCPATLANLLRAVHSRVFLGNVNLVMVFALGAAVDDVDTAKIALAKRDQVWTEDNTDVVHSIAKRNALDPGSWGVSFWRAISNADYIFAVIRAYDEVGNTSKLAGKFAEYLAAAKAV